MQRCGASVSRNSKRSFPVIATALALVLALMFGAGACGCAPQVGSASSPAASTSSVAVSTSTSGSYAADAPTYTFRSKKLLKEHYQKHGKAMGYADTQSYVAGANAVIADTRSLHKTQKEDGDDVYYLEATDEIVIISGDGYIRTYFNPGGIDYYNRQ